MGLNEKKYIFITILALAFALLIIQYIFKLTLSNNKFIEDSLGLVIASIGFLIIISSILSFQSKNNHSYIRNTNRKFSYINSPFFYSK